MVSEPLQWHSAFNVYELDNQDVLLLSATQEFFLSSQQFPFFALVDGVKSAGEILQSQNSQHQGALFYYHINQLRHADVLLGAARIAPYVQPIFESVDTTETVDRRDLSETCQMINLSALPERAMADVASVLRLALSTSGTECDGLEVMLAQPLNLIVVDDFVDPRIVDFGIAPLPLTGSFMVIKVSGDECWLSPVFGREEVECFAVLQQQILANQPIRKWLMDKFPHRRHGYAFVARQSLDESHSQVLSRLVTKQLDEGAKGQLVIYDTGGGGVQYHPVNRFANGAANFAEQLKEPIRLDCCLGRFNQDGGSRSVTAQSTVDTLMSLVSPVTGVINQLEDLDNDGGDSENRPEKTSSQSIKIYRSGFFKSHHKMTSENFEQNSFVQICLGKGVSHQQSQASALAEAVERYCAQYQSDIPAITSTESDLQDTAKRTLNFHDLAPYSPCQYQQFKDNTHADHSLKSNFRAYDDSVIHWLPGWSLTHDETVHLPLSQCFSRIPFDDDQFGRWNSNGCAAGNTLEEAILQALYELIERDATAIWWYNQVTRPVFDLSRLDQDNLAKLTATLAPEVAAGELDNGGDNGGHDFWVLDLTTDLGIPVMAAIGKHKHSGGWVMGFGCHLVPELAAQRALTELCQLIPIRDQQGAPFDFDAIVAGDYLYGDNQAESSQPMLSSHDDIKQDIISITARLNTLGFETVAVDYSRSHIPLATAKVFVPGLCHIWPQLGNLRLYQLPVQMGWLGQAKTEATINPHDLYI